MKTHSPFWKMSASLMAAVALLGSVPVGQAAGPALNGSLSLRPLTPTETKTYNLTNPVAQVSAGISTVGLGQAAYLEAMVNIAVTNANITNLVWTLTKPGGSSASLLASPLGTNIPVYKSADKTVYKTADRRMLRPDAVGTYTVGLTIQTKDSGSTNLSFRVTGATYLGIQTCAACHSGAFANVPDKFGAYTNTLHAHAFKDAINGVSTDHFSKSCIACHVVGYDTNSFAINSGFDDIATLTGWTFPTTVTNSNWDAMPSQLQNLANVQCESCHGPGSQHMFSEGITGNTNAISVTYAAADCGQCHDSLSHHSKTAEWNVSLHANTTRTPSGANRPQCVRCHTASGFESWAKAGGMATLNKYPTNIFWADARSTNILAYTGVAPAYTSPANPPPTAFEAITCQTCHDPHDASNPGQLRFGQAVTLSDGTTVTNAGAGAFCMQCHNNRDGSYTNMMAQYPLGKPTWAGGSAFGTHDSPQGDILEGVNAETYGKVIPSAAHANVISNTCAGCHMQPVASTDPAFLKAGGHTFKMSYLTTNNSIVTEVPLTTVCAQCHGKVASFDMQVSDYNGDGVIEGVQTEVQHLLDRLSTLLPPRSGYQANPANYVADGLVKNSDSLMAIYTNVPAKFLKAYYNWDIVFRDGSLGVHNAPFVVGLLKASIGDLTGDSNNDGISDAWQIAYFGAGFATNALAAPNAVNNSAGVPNWMMAALNQNPSSAYKVAGSGVISVNNGSVLNGDTNNIAIYTAAEIVFNTVPGYTYQVQGISQLTGSAWQNISTNIPGTGTAISYLCPTRGTNQMFYRVGHTP